MIIFRYTYVYLVKVGPGESGATDGIYEKWNWESKLSYYNWESSGIIFKVYSWNSKIITI